MPTFDQLQDRFDHALPPDDGPEPTEAHFNEAFDQLMQDDERLIDYINDVGPDTTTIFQLIHKYGGLPLNFNVSERLDVLHEELTNTADAFIDGYRNWLGSVLADRAEQVMRDEIDAARSDAEEKRADDLFLNGGW